MLLKFMTGIIAKEGNQDLITAFWESMTSNLDGVLCLGNDKKVELLMNLLGQIDKKYHNKILEKINLEFSKDNENAKHVVQYLYESLHENNAQTGDNFAD